ncbi:MAG: type II toxin-antitoxin system RelE/ParE family toxin [Lysobacterales bacterium CG02_land_8_20_14_3_00_62_12]|nr:MAG: type II toxin-antitoxin system RelE/ParE family toxin [Xanthomonadales bacterium CG02_land_8_20_14_3_00_62_12]
MKISLHPGAAKDIEEAVEFYRREGSPALAAKFVAEFKKLAHLLAGNPGIGSVRSSGRRGLAMNVFPYTAIYRASQDSVRILVVKHDRRRPGFGASRI